MFLLNGLAWHCVVKVYRFQMYKIQHLCVALCVHCQKSPLLPSPYISFLRFVQSSSWQQTCHWRLARKVALGQKVKEESGMRLQKQESSLCLINQNSRTEWLLKHCNQPRFSERLGYIEPHSHYGNYQLPPRSTATFPTTFFPQNVSL